MHPPALLHGPIAGDELERLWSALAAAPVATAVVGPDGRFLLHLDGLPGRRAPRPRPALAVA